MAKSPEAFRTISEVAAWLETPPHVLRFWESRFPEIAPVKRAGGRRYYRPDDMRLLGGIKHLLHTEGHTIKSVQERLKAEGPAAIGALAKTALPGHAGVPGEDGTPGAIADGGAEANGDRRRRMPEPESEIPPIGFFFDDSDDAEPAEAQSGTFAQSLVPEPEPEPEPGPDLETAGGDAVAEAPSAEQPEDGAQPATEDAPPLPGLFSRNRAGRTASEASLAKLPLPELPADPEDDAPAPEPLPMAARLRAMDLDALDETARQTVTALAQRLAAVPRQD